jgi:hypothetical protein
VGVVEVARVNNKLHNMAGEPIYFFSFLFFPKTDLMTAHEAYEENVSGFEQHVEACATCAIVKTLDCCQSVDWVLRRQEKNNKSKREKEYNKSWNGSIFRGLRPPLISVTPHDKRSTNGVKLGHA